MDKAYDPHAIEQHWYDFWEQNGHFSPQGDGEPYAISLPPPNVTGSLHMGHAFQDTIMDALIRYHRMQGRKTLWQPGTDHAGIATQMVVERQLEAEGKHRRDLGREAFVERVWKWKVESGGTILKQLRRLGTSLDWSRERFTMEPGAMTDAVMTAFETLYDQGYIYRGKRLVNWDPALLTAISDLEVVSQEENGHLWSLKYPLADGSGHVIVATTRPETMLGDSAVAVHPDDERYKNLIGKQVKLPLTGREVPIVADDYVDPEFGSGCVKITPAHDFNDYAIGQRHNLELINIFTPDAKINDDAPEKYRGMTREQAREAVLADLCNEGALIETKDHKLQVPRGDRSGVVIEPYLTDQWYVAVKDLAKPAIIAVESGEVRFVPDNWKNTYYEWMRNLEDWCISRQLWWGHRIPAWYDADGNIYVAKSEEHARQKYKLGDRQLRQETDVLDTWFSAGLWPFSTLGWPEHTEELATFYPNSVLVTGFDIIFFWVARMMMFGYFFQKKPPFKEIYIHGLIRDHDGQKMSKSKGNVLDPLDLIDGVTLDELVQKRTTGLMQPQMAKRIEQATRKQFPDGIPAYGTDALRFTFAALATTGRDIRFDLGRIEGYRNFCNKLWNAARFVKMNTDGKDNTGEKQYTAADKWIQTRLQQTIRDYRKAMDGYRLDLAAQAIYDFTWNEYCDWYLELTKPTLTTKIGSDARGSDALGVAINQEALQRGTRATLLEVLDQILRLLHPIMPFITEEIWQRTVKSGDTLMLARFPEADETKEDPEAAKAIDWVKGFILGIRRIRGEMDLSPSKPLPVLLQDASDQDRKYLAEFESWLTFLARLESIEMTDNPPESATALLGQMKILVPMAGLIDKQAELDRLDKQIQKIQKDLEKATAKLANEQFVQNAPQAVVDQERGRIHEWQSALAELTTQREKIAAL